MQSEKIGELAKALAEAQAEIAPPKKGRTASIKSEKGSYSYTYADLSDIIECYRKPLSTRGLALTQCMSMRDGHLVLSTKLLHSSDQWIASEYPIASYNRPQEQGSAITYARRYAVTALLGIAAEEDDDGAAAQNATPKPTVAVAKPRPVEAKAALTREEIESVHVAAKKAGIKTAAELAPILVKLCNVGKATDLAKTELSFVLDALAGMAREVPA